MFTNNAPDGPKWFEFNIPYTLDHAETNEKKKYLAVMLNSYSILGLVQKAQSTAFI